MRDHLLIVQRLLIGIGVALLAIWGAGQLHREIGQRQAMEAFEAARLAASQQRQLVAMETGSQTASTTPAVSEGEEIPTLPVAASAETADARLPAMPPPPMPKTMEYDYSLWSPNRVKDYEESLRVEFSAPQALLRIPAIDLEVPVLDGIDELTLNRAVGRIPGTARPDGLGNVGIAGHRDGFFRGLKDITVGDDVELVTWRQRMRYQVKEIRIVEKHDTHVLTETDDSMVTLVTCYPFYFVGHAPKRYIVKAALVDAEII
jgi:sortase A